MQGFGFKDRLFGGNSKARHTGPPRKAAWQALIEAENGAYYTIGLNSLTGADLEAWPQKGGSA